MELMCVCDDRKRGKGSGGEQVIVTGSLAGRGTEV